MDEFHIRSVLTVHSYPFGMKNYHGQLLPVKQHPLPVKQQQKTNERHTRFTYRYLMLALFHSKKQLYNRVL